MKKFRPKPKKKIFKFLIPVKEFLRDQPAWASQAGAQRADLET